MFIDDMVGALRRSGAVFVLPFDYSVQFLNSSVAAGATVVQNITIQSDSDFIAKTCQITVYDSPNNIVTTTLAPLTVQFSDTGSGRNLMDSAQSIQNLMGGAVSNAGGSGGSGPYVFPEPLLLRATATLQVTLTNLTSLTVSTGGRTFQRVDISFAGYKVFKNRELRPGETPYWWW